MSSQVSRRKFFPYDEVTASRDLNFPNRFILSAPWLTFQFDVAEEDVPKADQIAKKISAGDITAADLDSVNWLFSSMASYPFAYILPRTTSFGTDQHQVLTTPLKTETPEAMLHSLNEKSNSPLTKEWTWDIDAALDFSRTESGFDPESLFSISRRFHLLNDIENNKTAELLEFMTTLKKNVSEFKEVSAVVMRQNHYITERCEDVLSAALPISQNAQSAVSSFIKAEAGHDKILAKALRALGADAEQVAVLGCVTLLMDIFKLAAKRNFLAFSMIVDIFERTSYRDEDPFAKVLQDGGAKTAASQIEVHREINDFGGHENIAIEFLKDMGPVSEDYATEALRLSELATQVVHSISKDTLAKFKA